MFTSLRIVLRALNQFGSHNASQMGAALAYYTLFSLAPLLLVAILVAGLVFGQEAAQEGVYEELKGNVGPESARSIQDIIVAAGQVQEQTWAPYIGILISLFAGLQAFLHLRVSFRTIWGMERRGGNTLLGTLLDYGLSALMVLVVGLILMASLAASTVLKVVESRWPLPIFGGWNTVEVAASFVIVTLAFAAMYWVLSGRSLHPGYILYGSLISSILFTLGKAVLSWYLAFTSTTSVYGAAGSLVGFLIWVYYSSLIVFFGAELIQARRTRLDWLNRKSN
jgi:membrane protein